MKKFAAIVVLVFLSAAVLCDPAVVAAQRKVEHKIGDLLVSLYR